MEGTDNVRLVQVIGTETCTRYRDKFGQQIHRDRMCHFNGITSQLQHSLEEGCHKAKLEVWGDLKEACLLKTLCPTGRVWRKPATKQSLESGVTLRKPATKQSLESGVTLKKPATKQSLESGLTLKKPA